ncbi:MAG: CCA tRNA nucleotidyltransferase [Planctomycetota bacterium]
MSAGRDIAKQIVRTLRKAGHLAYFAGGCVRDELLGLEPTDYDVATDAPPSRVRELFARTQAVGEHFGVILVRLDGVQTEVATFRSDGTYADGRRPESVAFTTAEYDAQRRDFTINGLFFDPLDEVIHDHVGGQADLKAKVLRAIGEPAERFAEDHLRLLRAVRFASRFGLTIEPVTWAAMTTNAERLKLIAPERVGDEMRRMLTAPSAAVAVEMLRASGLMGVVLRSGSGDSLRSSLGFVPGASVGGSLAMLTDDVEAARRNLKLSNAETERMRGVLGWARRVDAGMSLALARRFVAHAAADDTRLFLRATGRAVPGVVEQALALPIGPGRLLGGGDLIAAGWEPGPAFTRVLEAVYDAQLEGRVATSEEALALACSLR